MIGVRRVALADVWPKQTSCLMVLVCHTFEIQTVRPDHLGHRKVRGAFDVRRDVDRRLDFFRSL